MNGGMRDITFSLLIGKSYSFYKLCELESYHRLRGWVMVNKTMIAEDRLKESTGFVEDGKTTVADACIVKVLLLTKVGLT